MAQNWRYRTLAVAGVLAWFAACGGKSPDTAPKQLTPTNPPAAAPSNSAPSTAPPSTPAPTQPAPQPAPPPAAAPAHGPDDTPIVIGDGSLWIGLNPLGGRGSGGKQLTFSNFDRQPGDPNEIREIAMLNLYDGTRLTWDGIDVNGATPSTCQSPAEECLIQIQYEGPGMDLEVSWSPTQNYNPGRKLVIRFPGRPVNQWIDWVRDSRIIFHPVDWDHSAQKKITQLFLNRTSQSVGANGNRITIHLKPEPR
ncbi:MAG TPA: hypothetical protein VKU19_35310 [Bryobacteraceae bacterium]|nr:hypothetical protein [Bryobacteraceae bacterium]